MLARSAQVGVDEQRAAAEAILQPMDFGFFYDPFDPADPTAHPGLLRGGFWPDDQTFAGFHYGASRLPVAHLRLELIHLGREHVRRVRDDQVERPRQTGEQRLFETPPLPPGRSFTYTLTAVWKEDQRSIKRMAVATVRAGKETVIDLRPGSKDASSSQIIYVPTPQKVVEKMLEMARVTKKDVVFDLGCGDGRLVVTAAKKYGARAIGIDIDPQRIKEEATDPLRHLPESNPFTYVERLLMIEAVAEDEGINAHVIPFPVNEPELWNAYVPPDVVQYIRLFSDWGGTKLERLRAAGYEVVVLDEGAEKQLSGADVRAAMREGGDWEALVPPGVAAVVRQLQRVAV